MQGYLITGEFKAVTNCRCESCCPGDPASTYTEAHRHACEARWVANLPSHVERRRFLVGVMESRGHEAYEQLRRSAWQLLKVAEPAPA